MRSQVIIQIMKEENAEEVIACHSGTQVSDSSVFRDENVNEDNNTDSECSDKETNLRTVINFEWSSEYHSAPKPIFVREKTGPNVSEDSETRNRRQSIATGKQLPAVCYVMPIQT